MSSLASYVGAGSGTQLVGGAQRLPPPIIIMRFMTARVATTALFTIALTTPSIDCVLVSRKEKAAPFCGQNPLDQPVPFRQRFSHLSIGLPLSFLSGLFAEITSPPFLRPFSNRGGPKPELPTPVTYFPRRYRDCDPFCRAGETEAVPLRRHSTFAPQMQQADRPPPRRGSPLCRNALTLRLHSFWRGIFHSEVGRILLERERPRTNPSETEQGVLTRNTVRAFWHSIVTTIMLTNHEPNLHN